MEAQSRLAKILGPLASGLIAAVLVVLTVLVAILLGSGEQSLLAGVRATATETTAAPPSPSATLEPTATPSPSLTPSPTPTPRPSAQVACIPPSDWLAYTVQPGETLTSLAWRFWTTEYSLMQANCLTGRTLHAGQIIYVPNVSPRPPCGRPSGWVAYTVQPGDTLYSIALRFDTTVAALKQANCLTSDRIVVGATLWVPYRPPAPTARPSRTPYPTATRTDTATPLPTLTPTSVVTGSVTPETPTPGTPTPETPTPGTPTPETPTPGTPTPKTPTPGTPTPETPTPEPTDTSPPPTVTETPSATPLPPTATTPPTNTPLLPTATDTT